jgi:hypothetical protein
VANKPPLALLQNLVEGKNEPSFDPDIQWHRMTYFITILRRWRSFRPII